MNIDILDEDGASNIAHPELFGKPKPNKQELYMQITDWLFLFFLICPVLGICIAFLLKDKK